MFSRTEPWIVENAIDFLSKRMDNIKNILEFGSGSSTIWFSQYNIQCLTIEHDKKWYDQLAEYLRTHYIININLQLVERPYYTICSKLEPNTFDLIFIDGRDRVKCLLASFPLLKVGGICLLDNSERVEYQPAIDFMDSHTKYHFTQSGPDKYGFVYKDWATTIWIKTHD